MLAGLLAAVVPITLIGLGLMLYNRLRFDNPFEFGQRYQIAGERQFSRQFFGLRYLWFNFRVYFLEPAHWSVRSPYVHGITIPRVPSGYTQVRNPFGILTNIPVVWLALAAPLAWRNRTGQTGTVLHWFVTLVALLFGICALTIGLFCGASFRYEVDFLPALVLVAVVGIFGVERVLAHRSPVWRGAARWGWCLLLGFSVALNLLAGVEYHAEGHFNLGGYLLIAGRVEEAVEQYERALWIKPEYAQAHNNLGNILLGAGKIEEAIGHYEQALRVKPDYAEAHYNLGAALEQVGTRQEAIGHYEQALRLKPDFTAASAALARLRATQVDR
jgi:tetratricopeptide (TPR) repeat protein